MCCNPGNSYRNHVSPQNFAFSGACNLFVEAIPATNKGMVGPVQSLEIRSRLLFAKLPPSAEERIARALFILSLIFGSIEKVVWKPCAPAETDQSKKLGQDTRILYHAHHISSSQSTCGFATIYVTRTAIPRRIPSILS